MPKTCFDRARSLVAIAALLMIAGIAIAADAAWSPWQPAKNHPEIEYRVLKGQKMKDTVQWHLELKNKSDHAISFEFRIGPKGGSAGTDPDNVTLKAGQNVEAFQLLGGDDVKEIELFVDKVKAAK